MTPKQILAWLRRRAPMIDWDVVDTGHAIMISAPYADDVRKIVTITHDEASRLVP